MGIPFASLILSSSSLTDKNLLITIYLVCELVMSLLTAFFYKLDKEKAKRGQWRTKEKRCCSYLGLWVELVASWEFMYCVIRRDIGILFSIMF